ncbi:DUF2145 domain-containing protein [Oxalobacteraceae bacterium A2-2]
MTARQAWAAGLLALAGAAQATSSGHSSAASQFCERHHELSAAEQDRVLRFAAVVREQLAAVAGEVALVSRSGLDLSRFGLRYSHGAIAWRSAQGAWSARQLYYACDEGRPRIYDQGMAGFAMGMDNADTGYISIVSLPAGAGAVLKAAALDTPRVLHLLAARYSANAYAYGTRYQNCNQWLIELLASAWGGLDDGDGLRERAQAWLRGAGYDPEPVEVGSRWLMLAAYFVPLLHLDDHPAEDRQAMRLRVSLPPAIEQFTRQRLPASSRVEICHNARQVVVHQGWDAVADGCLPGEGDRVIPLD